MQNKRSISALIGERTKRVKQSGNEFILFELESGLFGLLYHEQNCCEDVYIADVVGELGDLENTILWDARFDQGETGSESDYESFTWTFVNLQSDKGHVQIRFYGVSNGYYSEEPDFCLLTKDEAVARLGNVFGWFTTS